MTDYFNEANRAKIKLVARADVLERTPGRTPLRGDEPGKIVKGGSRAKREDQFALVECPDYRKLDQPRATIGPQVMTAIKKTGGQMVTDPPEPDIDVPEPSPRKFIIALLPGRKKPKDTDNKNPPKDSAET